MPTLDWLGKEKVVNHHLEVPFRTLRHMYGANGKTQSKTPVNSGNKVIHGDNLEALKALLPEYECKVKCIYIDPPYNTGNENWIYNDNVNSDRINKWLGKVVGKKSEDLARHDKWLCMMYPRIKLLHKLLRKDGAIFISIDDNEHASLKVLCDEIFGDQNFVNNVIWQKKFSPQNDARYLSDTHDFILVYAKDKRYWQRNLMARTAEQDKRYKNPDNDPRGAWTSGDLSVKTYNAEYDYPITTPSGKIVNPSAGRCWRTSKERLDELIADNRIWFGKDGNNVPRIKRFISEVQDGIVPQTLWLRDEVGDNQAARRALKKIFADSSAPFDTPKPPQLIQRILQIATGDDDIVLDSFAGSGTTAEAVLRQNKEDGSNRKFILVELEDYAERITAERIKRILAGTDEGYEFNSAFDFYTLGPSIFNEDGQVNDQVPEEDLRIYIYYSETRQMPELKHENRAFLGIQNHTAYYLHFDPKQQTILNTEFLATIRETAELYVIYADRCTLSDDFMSQHKIIFRKIPRDIQQR